MRHKNTKAMLDYWMELFEQAGNHPFTNGKFNWPDRSDIQPSQCRELVGDMFILDVDGANVNYRLAGTKLCGMFGRELKAESFSEAFTGADQRSIENWSSRLGLDEYTVLVCSSAETESGKTVQLETLLMPLTHNGDRSSRVLGITAACKPPEWLHHEPLVVQTIKSIRVIRPWEEDRFSKNWPFSSPENDVVPSRRTELNAPGLFKENIPIQAPFVADENDPTVRKVAHLMVIDGGKD